ncbi:unnamed protein product [Notodromas monacha]|uniref:C-type lectin domain-containing protein n=1 Tax=Notodromas monacha TaxID=399045 RepID=A0A7R9BS62_9CRUS|nr:unnamed protein product [Notodromas monacha]CAG0919638.1 unnamed protein product [Notodromas monacha]
MAARAEKDHDPHLRQCCCCYTDRNNWELHWLLIMPSGPPSYVINLFQDGRGVVGNERKTGVGKVEGLYSRIMKPRQSLKWLAVVAPPKRRHDDDAAVFTKRYILGCRLGSCAKSADPRETRAEDMKACVIALLLLGCAALSAGQARIHGQFGGSSYYYSWRENRGLQVGWDGANNFCRQLGMGLVSLDTPQEANFVTGIIAQERLEYIWTSGRRNRNGWVWSSNGSPIRFGQWSRTGGSGRPQPDNREGNEFCLAVLNNFYRDGILLPSNPGGYNLAPDPDQNHPFVRIGWRSARSQPGKSGQFGGSSYYYSWRENRGLQVGWDGANNFCRQLGMGLVSLDTPQEANFVTGIIAQERLEYIWTSGRRNRNGWVWSSNGSPIRFGQWSRTGGSGRPQPDNREGNEFCLAVLNNFYRDGIVWHDVSCHHQKPFICEIQGGGFRG